MSFFITPDRRIHLVRAWGLFVVAFVLCLFPLIAPVDSMGVGFIVGTVLLLVAFGFLNLRWSGRAPANHYTTTIPMLAPAPEQARYYRRRFWITAVAFAIVTGKVAYDLHQLETGAVKQVELLMFIAPIYENFGYWPTVVSVALVGVLCCVTFDRMARDARRRAGVADGPGPVTTTRS